MFDATQMMKGHHVLPTTIIAVLTWLKKKNIIVLFQESVPDEPYKRLNNRKVSDSCVSQLFFLNIYIYT